VQSDLAKGRIADLPSLLWRMHSSATCVDRQTVPMFGCVTMRRHMPPSKVPLRVGDLDPI